MLHLCIIKVKKNVFGFEGVTRVKIQKIGLKSTDWAQLFFEDVRVPAGNILGKEGDGFKQIMVQV